MEIYCGLCGQKADQLFAHLREVHEMSPDRYRERCQDAPLMSEDLAAYIRDARIVATEDGVKKQVQLFGVEFVTNILPGELVPQVDDAYVFQEDLAKQVFVSLRDSEKMLLVGPTGSGKSTLVEQLAARLNWPMARVAASGGLLAAGVVTPLIVVYLVFRLHARSEPGAEDLLDVLKAENLLASTHHRHRHLPWSGYRLLDEQNSSAEDDRGN